jgi:hypothetical protein
MASLPYASIVAIASLSLAPWQVARTFQGPTQCSN